MNPYYDAAKLNLELCSIEENLSYEFDIFAIWATTDGRLYMAEDSGCSCPTPFENYQGRNTEDVLQKLERVGSIDQLERAIVSWNKSYSGGRKVNQNEVTNLVDWAKERLRA